MHLALLHLRHALRGGVEKYLATLARARMRQGDRVTVLCRSHAQGADAGLEFVTLKGPALGTMGRRERFARDVDRHLREHGGYDVVYELGLGWNHDLIRLGWGCWARSFELSELGPAATLRRVSSGSSGRRPALRTRLAQVAQACGDAVERKRPRMLALERRALCTGRGAVVANSNFVAHDVADRYGVPPDRLHVVHNGVDLERYHPRHREEGRARLTALGVAAEDRTVLLFLGSGFRRKGLAELLVACEALFARRRELVLAVVGDDPYEAAYRASVEGTLLAGRVHFLGGRSDVPELMAGADLYVLPTHYDAFANTTLEALAAGTPIITTAHNGGHEVVSPDAGAVIPSANDTDALLAALEAWTPRDVLALRRAAARAAAERHPIETKVAEVGALFERYGRGRVGSAPG
jgi:UDP-glucose:(heptosyl)LPS alpha-1,3-glucosyltransferase